MKWHRHHFGSKRKSIFNTYQKQRNITVTVLFFWTKFTLIMIYFFYFHFLVAILGGNKLGSQSFWYWDLQSPTKLVKTLCPKGPFWPLPSFPYPTPSMQYCVAVCATRRKEQTPQLWVEGSRWEGCELFCSQKLLWPFEEHVLTILLLIVVPIRSLAF